MPTQGMQPQPDNSCLEKFRQQYSRVDHSRRGEAEDRAAHHALTLDDWHAHRCATCDADPQGKAGE